MRPSFKIPAVEKIVKLLGSSIRRIRTYRRLKLHHVAERSGLTVGYISQVELGRVSPSIETLHLLSQALGFSLTDLFRKVEEEEQLLRLEAEWQDNERNY